MPAKKKTVCSKCFSDDVLRAMWSSPNTLVAESAFFDQDENRDYKTVRCNNCGSNQPLVDLTPAALFRQKAKLAEDEKAGSPSRKPAWYSPAERFCKSEGCGIGYRARAGRKRYEASTMDLDKAGADDVYGERLHPGASPGAGRYLVHSVHWVDANSYSHNHYYIRPVGEEGEEVEDREITGNVFQLARQWGTNIEEQQSMRESDLDGHELVPK